MDVNAITEALKDFSGKHQTAFSDISQRQSQLLELAAVVGIQEHYRSNGHVTTVVGVIDGTFVVKTGTRGHPARYSRIRVEKDGVAAELHMNLLVRGAHDEGVYRVDVGIVQPGVVPEKATSKQKWICVENESLITFGEVKRLVVYPMLLAQFVEIVHEIKPSFFSYPPPEGFDRYRHLPPVLMALGHFSGNSAAIVQAHENRAIRLCIAENFDVRIAVHRKGTCASPLYWDVEAETTASGPALVSAGT